MAKLGYRVMKPQPASVITTNVGHHGFKSNINENFMIILSVTLDPEVTLNFAPVPKS